MKLLVITMENFQDIELFGFLGTLNVSGKIEKITYWNPEDKNEVFGSNKIGSIKTITSNIEVEDYDAVFVPGGAACINLRTNAKAIKIIKKFIEKEKWVFAICDAPNAIYENGIFNDKKYSSYPIKNIKNNSGENRNSEFVSVDGKYITGKCPSASVDLAIQVVKTLWGAELAKNVYNIVYGVE